MFSNTRRLKAPPQVLQAALWTLDARWRQHLRQLRNLLTQRPPPLGTLQRLCRALVQDLQQLLQQLFVRLWYLGWERGRHFLRRATRRAPQGRPLREAVEAEAEQIWELPAHPHSLEFWLDLLFPPPPETELVRRLAPLVQRAGLDRWGTPSAPLLPEDLAQRLVQGWAAGQTAQELSRTLTDVFQGARYRAARVVRTFGLWVFHRGQEESWKGVDDWIIGYTARSVCGPTTRPWHCARNGQRYYKNPRPGQKGLRQMPHPPQEPEDPAERPPGTPALAWNCLCWLEPIFAWEEG
jgi:hypothetical protein